MKLIERMKLHANRWRLRFLLRILCTFVVGIKKSLPFLYQQKNNSIAHSLGDFTDVNCDMYGLPDGAFCTTTVLTPVKEYKTRNLFNTLRLWCVVPLLLHPSLPLTQAHTPTQTDFWRTAAWLEALSLPPSVETVVTLPHNHAKWLQSSSIPSPIRAQTHLPICDARAYHFLQPR